MGYFFINLLLICSIFSFGCSTNIYNVVNYGAKGDGQTDDSQAFLKAWEAACADPNAPTLEIPSGKTFLLQPLAFQGPCKSSSIRVQIDGNIVAPNGVDAWSECKTNTWIEFHDVSNLFVVGSGKLDGRGDPFWKKVKNTLPHQISIKENSAKCDRPTQIRFGHCNNLQVSGITSLNSPRNHISINDCTGVSISKISLIAPENSPNTDGIDIASSTQINIFDAFVSTGDDCVAMNNGCSGINITQMNCAPGHGISVGSLGKNGAKETVEQIRVTNCIFNKTQNGARIKTWQGGSGYAKNIYFQDITLIDAGNPIIIDQNYFDHSAGNTNHTALTQKSAVAISDVKFIGFSGTSSTKEAIKLDCSQITGCNNIVLDNVKITSSTKGGETISFCKNAKGTSRDCVPSVPCLASQ